MSIIILFRGVGSACSGPWRNQARRIQRVRNHVGGNGRPGRQRVLSSAAFVNRIKPWSVFKSISIIPDNPVRRCADRAPGGSGPFSTYSALRRGRILSGNNYQDSTK